MLHECTVLPSLKKDAILKKLELEAKVRPNHVANENSTTGMPTEPWERSFRTVDFALILQNEATFHVGETIISILIFMYIYPTKWQEPVLVNLICLSVLRLFQMLRIIITPLVMEPSLSQQSAIWTSFCLDVLAHFFHLDWMEYLGMWCFLPFEIFRNGSNNLKHVHLFDLSLFSYILKTS